MNVAYPTFDDLVRRLVATAYRLGDIGADTDFPSEDGDDFWRDAVPPSPEALCEAIDALDDIAPTQELTQ